MCDVCCVFVLCECVMCYVLCVFDRVVHLCFFFCVTCVAFGVLRCVSCVLCVACCVLCLLCVAFCVSWFVLFGVLCFV